MTEEEKKAKELEDLKKLEEEKTTAELHLKKIQEMKTKMETMVDPEEYAKLKKEYKTLLDEYVDQRPILKPIDPVIRPAKEIAKELGSIKSGDISNRDYIVKTLEYRKSHLKEFGTDPFSDFSNGGSGKPTADTLEVVGILEKLLEENESPVDFRIKLNSVLKDDPQLMSKLRKRK